MLLDMIILVFLWVGIMMNTFTLFLPKDWDFLPWNWIGIVFFVCAIGIIRWRGHTSTGWLLIDFPSTNSEDKIGITSEGSKIYLQPLQKSIANFLKNKKDWYYRDNPEAPVSFGGHDCRLIDSETAYCLNTEKALFINNLSDSFYDYDQVKEAIKKEMLNMKNSQGQYLLSNSTVPLRIEQVDIDDNKIHKELFEHIMDKYFIQVHGRTYTLKNYHRFQEKQAAPYQIGSVIHYIKALSAMRAAGVKKSLGNWTKWLIVIAVIIIIVIVLVLMATGTIQFPSM